MTKIKFGRIFNKNPDANLWAERDRIAKRYIEEAEAETERDLNQAARVRAQRVRNRTIRPKEVSGTDAADANVKALDEFQRQNGEEAAQRALAEDLNPDNDPSLPFHDPKRVTPNALGRNADKPAAVLPCPPGRPP